MDLAALGGGQVGLLCGTCFPEEEYITLHAANVSLRRVQRVTAFSDTEIRVTFTKGGRVTFSPRNERHYFFFFCNVIAST